MSPSLKVLLAKLAKINEDLMAQRVVNWSYSNDFVRLDVDFGVSHDSDPHEVSRIAIESTQSVPRALTNHQPVRWLVSIRRTQLHQLIA